ncbi:hypothetical protein GCM10025868_24180 [Angustibacter aerolatus]|uniref:3-hydroxyacyl-CoA dehydrogenase NAD binding domain-containing protein n=1 Tax=Angustibacter aerolatus TaxID=1162965 RepID=A0ABQ6JIE3_9ACTN|nr:hypothetical protein GCM10025868_24180 [Angustibacter aerolatus]
MADLAGCRLVVEAVVEDLAVKRDLFAGLEQVVADDALLATNTSSISVTAVAAWLARPERVVGLHFFNPADRMRLVEVVRGDATSDAVVETAVEPGPGLGQDARRVHVDAGVHREPGGPAVLRRGAAHGRGGRRRPRDHRRRAARGRRVPPRGSPTSSART